MAIEEKCPCRGSFLDRFLQPSILLLLSREELHGFAILKRLREADFEGCQRVDPTGLYRTLRKMEQAELLRSKRETQRSGPARDVYGLTEKGNACLRTWAGTLRAYCDDVERLAEAVAAACQDSEPPV
ncbi:MAG TPA: transcriptional regulator [Synergistaceae bacterium]|nr:transcriptional regulator [Synergistaceae bacterium]